MYLPSRRQQRLCRLEWALFAAGALAMSFSLALARVQSCDYVSIDGDFQSYNVFRRMLAGQTPYVDFANYIGMAPVVLDLPLAALLGGSFAASLFATHFIANLLFSITVLLVFWITTGNRPMSMLAGVVFSKLCASGLLGLAAGPKWGPYFLELFGRLYAPSNSMRIARLFLPFLWVAAALALLRLWRTGVEGCALQERLRSACACLVLGFMAGAGVPWSNDFGLACLFCASALFVLIQALRLWGGWAAFWRRGLCYLGGAAAGALLSMALCTRGQPGAFVQSTRDVGGWQYFYFNGTNGKALLPYLFTQGRMWCYLLPSLAFLLWCLVRLCRRRLTDRQLLLGFLVFVMAVATGAYTVSGSGYHFTEALEGYTWLAALALLAKGCLWLARRAGKRLWAGADAALRAGAALAACLLVGLAVRDGLAWPSLPRTGQYMPGLGGFCSYTQALQEFPARTRGGTFSVYATGLETVEGRFQPTGSDYIIHALGQRRTGYLATFLQGRYPYVQTPRMDLERWLTAQNWDFYRYVWANYRRCGASEYSWLWQRSAPRQLPVQAAVKLERLDDATWSITVEAPAGGTFTADVRISYDTQFTGPAGAALSLGRRMVKFVTPLFGDAPVVDANLPACSGESYLPIRVEGGYGRAVLTACDPSYVQLRLHTAQLAQALPAMDLGL